VDQPLPSRASAPADGVFLDGWSLAEVPVRVVLFDRELRIFDLSGAELRCWPFVGLHVDAMQEGNAYHLTHASAGDEQLLLRNTELAARALASTPHVSVLPGGKHKLAYGLSGLGALLAVLAGLYFSVPTLSLFIARRIPLEQERALGGELDFLLTFDECDRKQAAKTLTKLLSELGEKGGVGYQVRVTGSEVPNAFALPGGVILVTRGFLREAKSGDEIAGVLAHEVEHIVQRHVLAGALRGVLLTALWSITFGDYSGLLVLDPSTAYQIATLEFSREDEQAADDGAVARLHRANLSHRGLISFFERISEESGDLEGPAWLSTHPSIKARLRALEKVDDVLHPRAPLTEAELEALRSTCSDSSQQDDTDAAPTSVPASRAFSSTTPSAR
jgi:beta-barrel assembly-enhancing protease